MCWERPRDSCAWSSGFGADVACLRAGSLLSPLLYSPPSVHSRHLILIEVGVNSVCQREEIISQSDAMGLPGGGVG